MFLDAFVGTVIIKSGNVVLLNDFISFLKFTYVKCVIKGRELQIRNKTLHHKK
jgi:hypothetical protein